MRILFLGDVCGRSGRDGVARELPGLVKTLSPEIVIVNAENAAAGFGLTLKLAQEFLALGVQALTTGNHVFDQRELMGAIAQEPRILRPLNYPDTTPGRGHLLHALPDGRKILIAHAMGRQFMSTILDDPFATTEKLIAAHPLGRGVQAIFIDFHAEATSEKNAYGNVFDGRVSAVVGTHTHIPTADERILPRGTAYQTDAGMCGDYDSVIGVKKEQPIWRFTRQTPSERFISADGEATVCGCFIETDDKTGLARSIRRIQVGGLLTRAEG